MPTLFTSISLKVSMLILSSMWLFGCTSSSPSEIEVTYYIFDANPLPQTNKQSDKHVPLKITSVKLPRYLSGDQLVMQSHDHSFVKANYHSWADNLDAAIKRAVISDINQTQSKFYAVNKCNACTSITVYIEHFYPTENGELLLSGYTEQNLNIADSKIIRFHYRSELKGSGYANAVKQMREQVSQLSDDILGTLD